MMRGTLSLVFNSMTRGTLLLIIDSMKGMLSPVFLFALSPFDLFPDALTFSLNDAVTP